MLIECAKTLELRFSL